MKENKQLDIFNLPHDPDFILLVKVFPESESDEIEYKSAQGGLPASLWETYSSFANTSGGIIVLGIKEKKNQIIIEGLEDRQIAKLQSDFWNLVNNKKKVSRNLLNNENVRQFLIEDKKLLAIYVPVADRSQKPIFLSENPFGNTYKRNHEGDYRCTDEEVRRMLADSDLNFHPDSRILQGFTLDDFDPVSLRQYRQLLSAAKLGHPWLALEDKELLIQLGALRKDRITNKEGPTLAGMLMFGKTLSIVDEECAPKFFPDYREFLSENSNDRWTDRVYPDGTWEANLFQFYRLVWPKLSSRLPKPFQLSQGQRVDETPAHEALREAFVNCLVHSDYVAPGNIVIESHLETFTFANPGTLLVTLRQYYRGGLSECRNTSLQKMFMMIGSAEKAGSGVSKILSGWSGAHWRKPYLEINNNPDRLLLEMPMLSTIPDETLAYLRNLFGENVDTLGREELTVLSLCHMEGEVRNSELQYALDIHKSDITILLQELCKKGFLVSSNKGRWTTYNLKVSVGNSGNEDNTNEDSSNEDSSNEDSTNEDSTNEDSSNEDSSNEDSSNEDSSNEDSLKAQRLSYDELKQNIIETCKNGYLSIEEIANAVGKSKRHLKNIILPKMIEEGVLEKRFPDNHPSQKYIAREKEV